LGKSSGQIRSAAVHHEQRPMKQVLHVLAPLVGARASSRIASRLSPPG
jgi:hypothetical protein